MVLDDADFDLTYDITGGEGLHPDFENPDFTGFRLKARMWKSCSATRQSFAGSNT